MIKNLSLILLVTTKPLSSSLADFFNNSYVVELAGGLMLSMMGLFLIWFLRPSVKIAPNISLVEKDNKRSYRIKVINRSYLFQLIDVQFELTMLTPKSTPNGTNLALKKIDLVSNHVWFLSRRQGFLNRLFSKDTYATYAIIITVNSDFDLKNEWKDNGTSFDLKVIAKNNFSGITSITHEKFNHYSCIKKGIYSHGNSLDIVDCD